MTTDHVGSARVVTGAQSAGRVPVLARYDYQPFGYFIPTTFPSGRSSFPEYAGNDDTTQKFTSKQRDQESSLDYFGFRYYASYQGRWTGTDPKQDLEANAAEPQTWNLYQYVRNAPLTRVDQDGRQEGTEESVLRMEMIKRGWTDQQIEQYFKEYRQGQIEGLKRGAVMAPLGVPALLDLLGRTYEFIGGAGAFKHWAKQSEQFFNQILKHLSKTGVDYVVIDLRGATKEQIKAIQQFVNS